MKIFKLALLAALVVAPALLRCTRVSAEDITDRKIAASDIIIVEVFGEKDLSGEHRVQQTGIIKFPLLGTVEVAGKTPTEVAAILTQKLETDYLVDPQV